MIAVFAREWKAYFRTPLGYVFVGAFFLFTGYFFYAGNLYGGVTDMRPMFERLFPVALFLAPVLTMRLMSEDRRLRTDQVLLCAPVSPGAVVLGKYLAALAVFTLAISGTLLDAFVMGFFGQPEWPVIFGNYCGLWLLGAALVALGLFLSSLTESQFIAVVCGFAANLALMLVDSVAQAAQTPWLRALLRLLSFYRRYKPFTDGVFDVASCVLFLSFAALFVAFSALSFDKRRWG